MMRLVALLLSFAALLRVGATPPVLEPIETVFARFSETYVSMCSEMISEVRKRSLQPLETAEKEAFEILERYVRNVRTDDIPGLRRAIQNQDERIPEWCGRLTVDIVGFRTTLDQLIIEAMSRGRLTSDDTFMKKLRGFWSDERYFSWRFRTEADSATAKR